MIQPLIIFNKERNNNMNAYEILEIYAGIAEIIVLVVIMYFGREVWWRAKDYD